MTVHPASQSSLMARKLCCRFLRRKALCAKDESLANQRHMVFSVCMVPPLGIVRWKFGSWILATFAGAQCCTSAVDAAESIKTVVHKFFGLGQLGLFFSMVLNKSITVLRNPPSTGLPHQAFLGFQSLFKLDWPKVLSLVFLQVLLEWSHLTFYPWLQQYSLGPQYFWGLTLWMAFEVDCSNTPQPPHTLCTQATHTCGMPMLLPSDTLWRWQGDVDDILGPLVGWMFHHNLWCRWLGS